MVTDGRLAGRVALVTGGGKGIGAHYVQGLARAGARVAAADIDAAAAEETARRLSAEGAEVIGLRVDTSDAASVTQMVDEVARRLGRLDVLVNNAALYAALMPKRAFHELEPEDWDRVLAVNVKGLFLCARAAFSHLRDSGHGRIINISSGTVFSGSPGFLHYVTSKGAVVAFTRALAREIGEYNITCNAIAPGLTASETAVAAYPEGAFEARAKDRAIARVQVPQDLVGAVVFLASDAAAFITGQTLVVDGGNAMH
ncbi:MAG TPA: SDR family oxidoreductase [Chloroflexota bacterium]|jgi:NAD(P)-dependent dehydrogenase (short-subunit alcohol dehydrogenase family)